MIREIKSTFHFLTEIKIKWWSIVSTTILGFLDSLANVSLLLGIGQLIANIIGTGSTKGNILKLLFGPISSSEKFIYVFVTILILKIFFLALKTYQLALVKSEIILLSTHLSIEKQPHKLSELKTNELSNFIAKGIIGFLSDTFFLLVVFSILSYYNLTIGFVFILFILLNILTVRFIYNQNSNRIKETQQLKSRYKKKQKLIHQFAEELQKINRLSKEKKIFEKRISKYKRLHSINSLYVAVAEAIVPLSFFSFLLFIAYSQSIFSQSLATSFLEITLLLIYSQGALRRNMRATRYWIVGKIELDKFNTLSNFIKETTSLENKVNINFPTLKILKELNKEEQEAISQLVNEPNHAPSNFRYFRDSFNLPGENLLSSLYFESLQKEKKEILELAYQLDNSHSLTEKILDKKSNFNFELSRKERFHLLIILSELDESELILFDSSYQTFFNELCIQNPKFLQKIYLCQ